MWYLMNFWLNNMYVNGMYWFTRYFHDKITFLEEYIENKMADSGDFQLLQQNPRWLPKSYVTL